MHTVHVQANELFAAANQTASEAFAAIRTVAAFSLQGQLGKLYKKLLEKPQACKASLRDRHKYVTQPCPSLCQKRSTESASPGDNSVWDPHHVTMLLFHGHEHMQ